MSAPSSHPLFLGIDEGSAAAGGPLVSVLPVPFERTTSYGKGTAKGPAAILRASAQVELYDEETHSEPYRMGIETLPPLHPEGRTTPAYLEALQAATRDLMSEGRFVICLGGEHTLTQAPVAAAQEIHGEVGVVHFDAHADLRDDFEGTRFSHACVMRRVHDLGLPTLSLGVRSLSRSEAEFIETRRPAIVWGRDLGSLDPATFVSHLSRLPDTIYVSFDLDFFDPSILPATGTPEPGGGLWWPTLELLKALFVEKEVIGLDVVELAPDPHLHACDFTAARLVYKSLAYLEAGRSARQQATAADVEDLAADTSREARGENQGLAADISR